MGQGRNGIIDLHGLFVEEAIERTDIAIRNDIDQGNSNLRLIVGQGHHSSNGPRLKPALLKHLRKSRYDAEVQRCNAGVIDLLRSTDIHKI
ncbi:hypothetical protein F5051DRAFT_85908 [Lentinula edodes]|nr:hypothetical protein F5051DRAFT_85908 [Lentinula edodes]